jgi:hypothetical protein
MSAEKALHEYLDTLDAHYRSGISTEHSYRADKSFKEQFGGYQPAQKWLKDRHGRTLDYEEILHYQKIVKALVLTDEIMQEIDEVLKEKER